MLSSEGSARTRRRAKLRRIARARLVSQALGLCLTLHDAVQSVGGALGTKLAQQGLGADERKTSRDLLPLPYVADAAAFTSVCCWPPGCLTLLTLVRGSVVGLNHLHGGRSNRRGQMRPNAAQREALLGIARRWWSLGVCLARRSASWEYDAGRFAAMVQRKLASVASPPGR